MATVLAGLGCVSSLGSTDRPGGPAFQLLTALIALRTHPSHGLMSVTRLPILPPKHPLALSSLGCSKCSQPHRNPPSLSSMPRAAAFLCHLGTRGNRPLRRNPEGIYGNRRKSPTFSLTRASKWWYSHKSSNRCAENSDKRRFMLCEICFPSTGGASCSSAIAYAAR